MDPEQKAPNVQEPKIKRWMDVRTGKIISYALEAE
jgi:hypothetical protein